jgi:hypothetical protein
MALFGILLGLALLVWLAYRGWSILLLAPGAALIAVAFARGPLLAYWTRIFMDSASRFVAQFLPLFPVPSSRASRPANGAGEKTSRRPGSEILCQCYPGSTPAAVGSLNLVPPPAPGDPNAAAAIPSPATSRPIPGEGPGRTRRPDLVTWRWHRRTATRRRRVTDRS